MPPTHPAGFEPVVPGSERPQTQALDRAATGITHASYKITSSSLIMVQVNMKATVQRQRFLPKNRFISLVFSCVNDVVLCWKPKDNALRYGYCSLLFHVLNGIVGIQMY